MVALFRDVMSALRAHPGLSRRDLIGLDAIDIALLEGVEAQLPMEFLLRSAACSSAEAEARVAKLIARGVVEEEDSQRASAHTLRESVERSVPLRVREV